MLIKGSFKQQNILWEVYFKSDLYPEVSLEIGSSPDGIFSDSSDFQVYFSSDAVEVTTESPEDTFQPIIKHSATVNLLTKTYIGQYFWSESPLDIRVEIFTNTENHISVSNVRVKGSDLYLALKNYSKVKSKSGQFTGIV